MAQEVELEPSFIQSRTFSAKKVSNVDYLFKVIDTLDLPFIDDFSTNSLAAESSDNPDTVFYQYKYRLKDSSYFAPAFDLSLDTTFQTVYTGTDTLVSALPPADTIVVYDFETYPLEVAATLLVWPNYNLLDSKNSGIWDTTLLAPFSNDSAEIGLIFPSGKLWVDRKAWINNNYALNMPSIGVATLDAVDETGYLYSSGNTKPFIADSLTSKPLDLSSYSSSNNLFLSFMVQPGGRGDAPETQDELKLEFLKDDGNWDEVWTSAELDALVVNEFTSVYVALDRASYFFKGFQFRFSNEASVNNQASSWQNNADLWHLDYVILDQNRNNNDNYIQDACFISTPSSHIEGYFTVPLKHYSSGITLSASTAKVANYVDLANDLNFSTLITAGADTVWEDLSAGSFSVAVNDTLNFTQNYSGLVFSTNVFPGLNTVSHRFTAAQSDLIPSNNSTEFIQNLEQFYAYDDGSSEAGYGINFFEGAVAVQYELLVSADTLTALDLYFNNTLSQANFEIPFQLMVWEDNGGKPGAVLYEGFSQYPKAAGTPNNFTSYELDEIVIVSGTFYVGWKQLSDQLMNVGLDKQENAKEHLFYNVGSGWTNSSIDGAIMVHPRFGYQQFLDTEVPKANSISVFPNPCENDLMVHFDGVYDAIQLIGIDGTLVHFENRQEDHQYSLKNLSSGMYLIQLLLEGNVVASEKVNKR